MRMRSWQPALRVAIRDLNPGYFALVMATASCRRWCALDGALSLSGFLLAAAIAACVLLAAAYAWRLAGYRREFLADAGDPRRAFASFTFAAGSDVLAARLAGDGHTVAAAALLAVGGASWLLLSYSLLLAGRPGPRPALAGANGTWLIWVVATQSVAVAATSLHPPVPGPWRRWPSAAGRWVSCCTCSSRP